MGKGQSKQTNTYSNTSYQKIDDSSAETSKKFQTKASSSGCVVSPHSSIFYVKLYSDEKHHHEKSKK